MAINEKKSFEELLREKVQHHEYPFESNSWAAMQSKLQAHQVQAAAQQSTLYKSIFLKAGKVFIAVISGASIVYSALSLSGVIDNKENKDTNNNLAKNEVVVQEKQEQNTVSNNTNSAAFNSSQQNNADINANAANTDYSAENNVASSKSAQNKELQKTAENNFNTSATASNVNTNTKHFSGNAYMHKAANQTADKHSIVKNIDLNNLVNANTKPGNVSGNEVENIVANNVNNSEIKYGTSYNTIEEERAEFNAGGNNSVNDVAGKTDVTVADENTTALQVDSTISSPVVGSKYPDKPVAGKSKTNLIFALYGGMNFNRNRAEVDGSTTIEIAGTPMFGFSATLPLNNGFAVQGGAQYLTHEVKNVSHSSAIVQYAILQDSSVTKTTFTQCKYIEFPLMLKYALAPRWNVYTGLRTSLLMGAKATISQERYSNKKLVSSTPAEDGGKFAQYNGLRSVDFGIPFGIEYSVYKHVSLAATFNYGLSDFTINDVFKNSQKDRHSSLLLQVNIKPFNK